MQKMTFSEAFAKLDAWQHGMYKEVTPDLPKNFLALQLAEGDSFFYYLLMRYQKVIQDTADLTPEARLELPDEENPYNIEILLCDFIGFFNADDMYDADFEAAEEIAKHKKNKLDLRIKTVEGSTLFHIALQFFSKSLFISTVTFNEPIDPMQDDHPGLFYRVLLNNALKHGFDFTLQDNDGNTIAHLMAANDKFDYIFLSKVYPGTENITNKKGQTPLDIAIETSNMPALYAFVVMGYDMLPVVEKLKEPSDQIRLLDFMHAIKPNETYAKRVNDTCIEQLKGSLNSLKLIDNYAITSPRLDHVIIGQLTLTSEQQSQLDGIKKLKYYKLPNNKFILIITQEYGIHSIKRYAVIKDRVLFQQLRFLIYHLGGIAEETFVGSQDNVLGASYWKNDGYDEDVLNNYAAIHQKLIDEVVASIANIHTKTKIRLIELGCGNGVLLAKCAGVLRKKGYLVEAVGYDQSPGTLKHVETIDPQQHNITLETGDVTQAGKLIQDHFAKEISKHSKTIILVSGGNNRRVTAGTKQGLAMLQSLRQHVAGEFEIFWSGHTRPNIYKYQFGKEYSINTQQFFIAPPEANNITPYMHRSMQDRYGDISFKRKRFRIFTVENSHLLYHARARSLDDIVRRVENKLLSGRHTLNLSFSIRPLLILSKLSSKAKAMIEDLDLSNVALSAEDKKQFQATLAELPNLKTLSLGANCPYFNDDALNSKAIRILTAKPMETEVPQFKTMAIKQR